MSPEIQQRVINSAVALGYQVNLLGRALRQQRLNIIGLVVPDLQNPFFAALAEQLAHTLRAGGFDLLICSSGGSVEAEARSVQSFLGQQIHALIVIPSDESHSIESLQSAQRRLPTVQFDRKAHAAEVPYVGCDNFHGMRLVAEHILAVADSERPVIYVGANPNSSSGHERLTGFRQFFPESLCLSGSFSVEWGRRAAELILERETGGATLVAAADVIALGLLTGLQAEGYRVPEDFRVIGFDGIGVTDLAQPALTTIRQPVEAMTETIFKFVNGEFSSGSPEQWRLPPELIIGASSPT